MHYLMKIVQGCTWEITNVCGFYPHGKSFQLCDNSDFSLVTVISGLMCC